MHLFLLILPRSRKTTMPARGRKSGFSVITKGPYQGFPAEDVAVEANPIFREVESALKKNVSLECT